MQSNRKGISEFVKCAYLAYFKVLLGDQDKAWAAHIVCKQCVERSIPTRVKGKVYSSVVRPAMVYGLETVEVTKKQVEEMEVAKMKMLRSLLWE